MIRQVSVFKDDDSGLFRIIITDPDEAQAFIDLLEKAVAMRVLI